MFFRITKSKGHEYLLLVESVRINGKVVQKTISNFGLFSKAIDSGAIERLVLSGAKFLDKLIAISELNSDNVKCIENKIIGPSLLFGHLWSKLQLDKIINSFAKDTKHKIPLERIIFMTVVNRLVEPGSDRACINWLENNELSGCSDIQLHHCYRAMRWLGTSIEKSGFDELPEPESPPQTENYFSDDPVDAEGFFDDDDASDHEFERVPEIQSNVKAKSRSKKAPIPAKRACSVRSVKDLMEEAIFAKRRNLFTKLQLVFFDTTSVYFEGKGGDELGRRGHSKDHRPDLNQVVVGVVMDQMGFPVCTEVWPGNTADVTTLLPISERLKKRFNISNVCIVADRGMISKNTIEALKDMNWNYILGAKMRRAPDMKEVFADDSPFIEVVSPRTKLNDPAPLKVKEVIVGDNRYIVCLNDEEAAKDRHTRDEIIKKLEEAIKNGDKSLVGNKGFRRYIVSKKNYAVNYQKIEEEKQYDGIFILRTDLKLPSQEIALQYKQLLGVETIFRTTKSIFETRPIFHQNDETIRGHIWCSYLAILLRKTLMDALEQNKKPEEPKLEWNDVVADLKMLTTTEAEVNGKRIRLRPSAKPGAARAFRALGLGLPKLVELLGKVETV